VSKEEIIRRLKREKIGFVLPFNTKDKILPENNNYTYKRRDDI